MNSLRTTPESRETLQALLEQLVREAFGLHRTVLSWTRRVSVYSSSCRIINLTVRLDDGRCFRWVLKNLGSSSWLPTAREVRPAFLYHPEREIAFYRDVLTHQDLGTPRYFGSAVDPRIDRYWLVTERVEGPLLWQLGSERHWLTAARWLAEFHGRLADGGAGFEGWIDYDEPHFIGWAQRAETHLKGLRTMADPGILRSLGRIIDRYDRVAGALSRIPATVIHGEYYPSNVIMRRTREGHSACPVDWELVGRGPAVLDVAALSFGRWSEEKKRRMVGAYHALSRERGDTALPLKEFNELVEYGYLHLCIRQLGWAKDWSPPAQHARDWMRDAVGLGRSLGML